LHGILYLHRITDIRMGGISTRSFRLFKKICGDDTLKNVVIATTKWDLIAVEEGARREQELRTDGRFFKRALDLNAILARHNNTVGSAREILRTIFKNHPMALMIQRELVDEHRVLSDTLAGKEIGRQLSGEVDTGYDSEWQDESKSKKSRKGNSLLVSLRKRMTRDKPSKKLEGIRQIVSTEVLAVQEELTCSVAELNKIQDHQKKLNTAEDNMIVAYVMITNLLAPANARTGIFQSEI
jgi:NADH dehydrogenase/NADH:ubiquinone oxidoreductase subunit G